MVQTFFNSRFAPGFPGAPCDQAPFYDRSYNNNALDIAGVNTVTVATYAASTAYPLTINGLSVSVETPASGGTTATTRNQLVAAINESFAGVYAVAGSGSTFTITGQTGEPLTVVLGTGNLIQVVTTATVTTGDIPLGSALVQLPTDDQDVLRLGAPNASHRFVGVAIDDGSRTQLYPYNSPNGHVYRRNDKMLVREAGTAWVAVEGIVTPSSKVFYRYSGTGILGAFLGATASGADIEIMNARFLTESENGIAQLLLGYSNYAPGTNV